MGTVKKSNVTIPEPEISQKLHQVLSDHFAVIKSKDMEYSFLPSLVLIVKELVHKDLWDEKWDELIHNYLLSSNPRVVSNAIEVFEFYNENILILKNNLKSWQHENRILAVYLLAKLKRSLNASDVNELSKLLFSEKPLFQASALYVIEEVLRFYFEKDPVVYKTNDYLQTLKGNVNKIEPNENEMLIKRLQRVKSLMKNIEEKLHGFPSNEIKI